MHTYSELLKPSVVTHSLLLEAAQGELLIVVRGHTLLQVFDDIHSTAGPRWLAEFPLQGSVSQIAQIDGKYVALTFLQAKMVVMEWDAQHRAFKTLSLHYYEKLKDQSNFDVASIRNHKLSVDDRNKCLVFWFQREFAALVRYHRLVDPLYSVEHEVKTESSIIKLAELKTVLKVSEIADIALLPAYREPTLAVLSWTRPTWAGLAGADGELTKELSIVSLKSHNGFKLLVRCRELRYDVHRIIPLTGLPEHPALLLGCDEFMVLNGAGSLSRVQLEYRDRLENCTVSQLPGSHYVLACTEAGSSILINVVSSRAVYLKIDDAWQMAGGPSCIAASSRSLVLSSRYEDTLLGLWSDAPEKAANGEECVNGEKASVHYEGSSLQELYAELQYSQETRARAPTAKGREGEVNLVWKSRLSSYGVLSGICSIDNGLACGTRSGVLIVEREMPLDELSTADLNFDVEPGRFWIAASTVASRPVLILTQAEAQVANDKDSGEEGTPRKRRRRSIDGTSKERTQFSEVYGKDRRSSRKKSGSAEPRGLATDQLTLAVCENSEAVVVVQSKSIIRFEPRTWKLLQKIQIPHSRFAEIRDKQILLQNSQTDEFQVYCAQNLDPIKTVRSVALASVSGETLVTVRGGILNVTRLDRNEEAAYDIHNLEELCEPLSLSDNIKEQRPDSNGLKEAESISNNNGSTAVKSESPEEVNESPTEATLAERAAPAETTSAPSQPSEQVTALFALRFGGTDYVGLHVDRVFVIYEQLGSKLLKRFSVPFQVNQSPIFIPEFETLVFPGAKTHAVVKGRQSSFNCHRLQLYGDQLADLTTYFSHGKHGPELVWLDTSERIHFARPDRGLDIFSNTLPLRAVKSEVPGISVKTVAYHEEFAAVIVGANAVVAPLEKDGDAGADEKDEAGEAAAADSAHAELDGEVADAAAGSSAAVSQEGDAASTRVNSGETIGEEEEASSEDPDDGTSRSDGAKRGAKPRPVLYEGRVFVLPLTTYKFQREPALVLDETLLSLKLVDYGDAGGKQLLAVGTSMSTAERAETNGHIRVYKIEESKAASTNGARSPTVSGSGSALASAADQSASQDEEMSDDIRPLVLEPFAEQLVRGAVSSLCEIMGYLAVAHGTQIHLYNFHKHLEPIGFFDTQVYMQDLKAVRNILILGERLKGPRLVNFALQPHRLDLLASPDGLDPPGGNALATQQVTAAVEGVSSGVRGDLAAAEATLDGRLQLFQYDPENPASNGGPHLVPLVSFFTGRVCTGMDAVQLYGRDDIAAYGANADGAVFSVRPLSEEGYRTLFVLTQQMMDKEPSVAALNPRAHRSTLADAHRQSHQLIDVNYAQQFWGLALGTQREYARKLGLHGLEKVQRALNAEGRDLLKL